MKNKLFFILVLFLCVFSLIFIPSAYSENLRMIRVYGIVSYQGIPLTGAPVNLFYGYEDYSGSYHRLSGDDIATVYTNQYGYYNLVTNVDLDRMDEIAAATSGGWCGVKVSNNFYGLYHPSGHPIGIDVRTYANFNVNFTDTENRFENMFDPIPQISGIFLDRSGTPIGNAKLSLDVWNDSTGAWESLTRTRSMSPKNVVTNSNGYFNLFIDNVHYGITDASRIRISLTKAVSRTRVLRGEIEITRTDDSIVGDFERYNVIIREL